MHKTRIYPTASVIIPVKNEEEHIGKCIEQLLNQTYPKDEMEIIVVDGMSSDRTREHVERSCDQISNFRIHGAAVEIAGRIKERENEERVPLRLIDNPNGQRASALNIGIREAKGDVIIRVDARNVLPSDYVSKCVETLIETNADNAGGVQKPIAKKLTQKAIGFALSHPFGIGNAQFRLGKKSGYVDTVYLGCFRKDIFDRVGLFDEDSPVISEDSDMNYRIREAGGKVYLNKDIVAYYYPRDSLRQLWQLYFRYGGAKAGNFIKNKKLTAWRQLVPPLFILTLVALALFSWFDRYAFYLLVFVLTIYFSVDLIVSFRLALKNKKISLLPRLFMVFPILHFSWGLGFFRRLLQRAKPGRYWGY